MIIQDIFQPIPMAVYKGYTKLGTIYPKGWNLNGKKLTYWTAVATKTRYQKQLEKHMKKNYSDTYWETYKN